MPCKFNDAGENVWFNFSFLNFHFFICIFFVIRWDEHHKKMAENAQKNGVKKKRPTPSPNGHRLPKTGKIDTCGKWPEIAIFGKNGQNSKKKSQQTTKKKTAQNDSSDPPSFGFFLPTWDHPCLTIPRVYLTTTLRSFRRFGQILGHRKNAQNQPNAIPGTVWAKNRQN